MASELRDDETGAPPFSNAVLEALEHAHIGFTLTVDDAEGVLRYVHVNSLASEILGVPAADLIGQPVLPLIAPEDAPRISEFIELRRRGEPVPRSLETSIIRPDGTRVAIEVGRSQVTYRGSPANVAFFTDISGRQRIAAELRSSEERFRRLVEQAPDCIGVWQGGHFVLVNPAMTRLLGYATPELIYARPLAEMLSPDDRDPLSARINALQRGEQVGPREYRIRRADGSLATLEVSSLTIEYDGAPAILGIGRDITERRRLQAQLLQSDRMATVGTVAAGVAHEINNPLTYVLLNLDALARELPRLAAEPGRMDRVNKLLDEARGGIRRVSMIVRDLRTFSRSDLDDVRPIDVRTVLASVINIANEEVRHRARLVTNLVEVPLVAANEPRLGQVFLNLIVNAAQAIPEGDPDRHEIRLTTEVDAAGHVVVEVADTGIGIDPALLGAIFDPFFTTKPIGVGTGLGLFICQGIVSELGGEITVDSAPGQGSRFRVVLPPRRP